ncbi:uncharacterized protein I206_101615 [Kwoniella pini CBS 10737]|uniref:Uncharacterized protein n=1 Tax=Kwoniella pini CBS 10737 TaxID=1296096 RepID=A0A1B9HW66_9TREE|nr:uncharacterized protein I206_06415 [Kwoniella pini CBS 10737]OCF47514.1 hypothetical protein I206_06415 [Kwoniella pini CBS 10737]
MEAQPLSLPSTGKLPASIVPSSSETPSNGTIFVPDLIQLLAQSYPGLTPTSSDLPNDLVISSDHLVIKWWDLPPGYTTGSWAEWEPEAPYKPSPDEPLVAYEQKDVDDLLDRMVEEREEQNAEEKTWEDRYEIQTPADQSFDVQLEESTVASSRNDISPTTSPPHSLSSTHLMIERPFSDQNHNQDHLDSPRDQAAYKPFEAKKNITPTINGYPKAGDDSAQNPPIGVDIISHNQPEISFNSSPSPPLNPIQDQIMPYEAIEEVKDTQLVMETELSSNHSLSDSDGLKTPSSSGFQTPKWKCHASSIVKSHEHSPQTPSNRVILVDTSHISVCHGAFRQACTSIFHPDNSFGPSALADRSRVLQRSATCPAVSTTVTKTDQEACPQSSAGQVRAVIPTHPDDSMCSTARTSLSAPQPFLAEQQVTEESPEFEMAQPDDSPLLDEFSRLHLAPRNPPAIEGISTDLSTESNAPHPRSSQDSRPSPELSVLTTPMTSHNGNAALPLSPLPDNVTTVLSESFSAEVSNSSTLDHNMSKDHKGEVHRLMVSQRDGQPDLFDFDEDSSKIPEAQQSSEGVIVQTITCTTDRAEPGVRGQFEAEGEQIGEYTPQAEEDTGNGGFTVEGHQGVPESEEETCVGNKSKSSQDSYTSTAERTLKGRSKRKVATQDETAAPKPKRRYTRRTEKNETGAVKPEQKSAASQDIDGISHAVPKKRGRPSHKHLIQQQVTEHTAALSSAGPSRSTKSTSVAPAAYSVGANYGQPLQAKPHAKSHPNRQITSSALQAANTKAVRSYWVTRESDEKAQDDDCSSSNPTSAPQFTRAMPQPPERESARQANRALQNCTASARTHRRSISTISSTEDPLLLTPTVSAASASSPTSEINGSKLIMRGQITPYGKHRRWEAEEDAIILKVYEQYEDTDMDRLQMSTLMEKNLKKLNFEIQRTSGSIKWR